jgi:DNA-binding transcriptional regulator YdaS (Cro superfamily)
MADWKVHLNRAVRYLGSQTRLASSMGCSQSKISWLLVTAEEISAEDAILIDRATNGEVSKEQLRPDLFAEASAA